MEVTDSVSSHDRKTDGKSSRKDHDTGSEDSRTRIGRKFLSMLKVERPKERYPSNKTDKFSERLGKAELGKSTVLPDSLEQSICDVSEQALTLW